MASSGPTVYLSRLQSAKIDEPWSHWPPMTTPFANSTVPTLREPQSQKGACIVAEPKRAGHKSGRLDAPDLVLPAWVCGQIESPEAAHDSCVNLGRDSSSAAGDKPLYWKWGGGSPFGFHVFPAAGFNKKRTALGFGSGRATAGGR